MPIQHGVTVLRRKKIKLNLIRPYTSSKPMVEVRVKNKRKVQPLAAVVNC